jgi:acetolactate synthase-1/2/3 large subunit
MYTVQALWTQAREGLDVTNIIFANHRYAILQTEQQRAGVQHPGPVAQSLFDLENPTIDWCALAKGMGVPAERPSDAESFHAALQKAFAEPGPHLIEAVIPNR